MARKNSKLFAIGPPAVSVNLQTGEETIKEGSQLRMLPGPPGTCEMCHTKHDEGAPHNQESLAYRMKFHELNGRRPTWSDAMAHCSEQTKSVWRRELVKRMQKFGVPIPPDLQDPPDAVRKATP